MKLVNVATDKEQTFKSVGPDEAGLKVGRISVSSPLARALLGREAGDEVKVQSPSGETTFEVLDVSFS